ncbi:Ubiquitin carboxyl-terminal hydrolase 28 [Dissostichus eleginoides]|uniref:Ubiquitin carboxyl-terminal hydrolase 28 n=1 Tax=Dissostichus eleginoides TaxID=100907 RepID=A0AAD9FEK6_DISEL|nr:Ubiquitin carboxyl-terminal hydrolase 28 [Dissostichus eleginoides]KAK1903198.1 Ubiquitin carboxyl-terminal hydrolase 28 [Dissostichus eleginoides]
MFSHGSPAPRCCLRGGRSVGHVASRRPSLSASTSGFNPPWRTWQIALATPAHGAAGCPARTPASPLILPQPPPPRPRARRLRGRAGHWR